MITVVDNSNTRGGLHCTAYPSPSALESCAICADKFRMEQSVQHDTGGEYESSEDARRGTAIHKATAILLKSLINSTVSTGSDVTKRVLYTSSLNSLSKIAGWDNSYFDLAYRAVIAAYRELKRIEAQYGDVDVYLEKLVKLDNWLNGYYGTADVVAITENTATVMDYKFGYRKVAAYENKQLVCYASAFAHYNTAKVTLLIIQPTIGHYDYYVTTWAHVNELMKRNVALIKDVSNLDVVHAKRVSDASCTYCIAKNSCSAYKNGTFGKILNAINADREMSDEERAELYMMINSAEQWKKNNRDALIKSIKEGKCNGFYLTQNKEKVSVDKNKVDEALAAIKPQMEDLILAGGLDYDWKFDLTEIKKFYGDEFEQKLGRFLKHTPGNVVIKRRDDDGHDA